MTSPRPLLSLPLGIFLSAASLLSAADPKPIGKPVTWTTPDGVRLAGLFHPPDRPQRYVWILLHGLGSNKQEWLDFARRLAERGDGFLIYDARGHGESVHRAHGGAIDYREFRTLGVGSEWDGMADDLRSAVGFLASRFSLDVRRIAVGGASLGANVALVYAGRRPEVPALLLLSPGLQYAGVEIEEAFRRYGKRPLFMAASPADAYAYESVRRLAAQRNDSNCVVAEGEGAAHGVHMLNEAFTWKLLEWMKELESH